MQKICYEIWIWKISIWTAICETGPLHQGISQPPLGLKIEIGTKIDLMTCIVAYILLAESRKWKNGNFQENSNKINDLYWSMVCEEPKFIQNQMITWQFRWTCQSG